MKYSTNFSPQAMGYFEKSAKHLDIGFDDSAGGHQASSASIDGISGHDGH